MEKREITKEQEKIILETTSIKMNLDYLERIHKVNTQIMSMCNDLFNFQQCFVENKIIEAAINTLSGQVQEMTDYVHKYIGENL